MPANVMRDPVLRTCRCCDGHVAPTRERTKFSAFVVAVICAECLARETREGFYWRDKALAEHLWIKDQGSI